MAVLLFSAKDQRNLGQAGTWPRRARVARSVVMPDKATAPPAGNDVSSANRTGLRSRFPPRLGRKDQEREDRFRLLYHSERPHKRATTTAMGQN